MQETSYLNVKCSLITIIIMSKITSHCAGTVGPGYKVREESENGIWFKTTATKV